MPLKMNCKIEIISNQALEKGSHPWFPMLYIERNTPTEGTRYWKVCLNRWFHLLLKRYWREGGRWELLCAPSIGLLPPSGQSSAGPRRFQPPVGSAWHSISLCSSRGRPTYACFLTTPPLP